MAIEFPNYLIKFPPECTITLGQARKLRGTVISTEDKSYVIAGVETFAMADDVLAGSVGILLKEQ
jgi:hypothetical protein